MDLFVSGPWLFTVWTDTLKVYSKTVTEGQVGGAFTEMWLGPYVRGQWRWLFAELGYGALGMRWDDARNDLPDEGGEVDHPGLKRGVGKVHELDEIITTLESHDPVVSEE